ncbi:DUF2306 domain-containing protein [Nocardioides sp. YIM 152315]|uniref:DUF2306 domain-containing protein n=1 Tax=Nocardioides sp. YIM 152315 TaxID=3031760 RepID=UPI0023D9E867|nr:DUF2306 domain-containing protein [Nocardioides sp. YIM 152315]MDF1602733.1 DUF2306 domain-containing protein [Nocardioides sp. YIM 152315]
MSAPAVATVAATGRRQVIIPVPLLVLSLIPLAAGALRLIQLAGGPEVIPADDRFAGLPVALVVHIVGAAGYALVGAFQFVPRFRRKHPNWHRRAGRVLAVDGLLVVGSALWLTLFYPAQPGTGDLLYVFRLIVVTGTASSLVLGVTAARRRDLAAHRAWMMRAYALGLGAGTQVLTEGFGEAFFGAGVLAGDLAKGAAWVINLAVAEWLIRRPARRPVRRSSRRSGRDAADGVQGPELESRRQRGPHRPGRCGPARGLPEGQLTPTALQAVATALCWTLPAPKRSRAASRVAVRAPW